MRAERARKEKGPLEWGPCFAIIPQLVKIFLVRFMLSFSSPVASSIGVECYQPVPFILLVNTLYLSSGMFFFVTW